MKDNYKNIHSHIFTMDNAPELFLNLYLPEFLAKGVDNFTNTEAGAWVVEKIAKRLGKQGKRYATFLQIGKSRDQLSVFKELLGQYNDTSMEMVALTINMEYLGAGHSVTGYEGQLQQVIDIKRKYPDRLLLFMGIDPRWKSSGTELRKTVERYFETKIETGTRSIYPFCGLKLYTSTGFFAFDEKLKETYQWAADNGVPIMTHCSYLGGLFNYSRETIASALTTVNPYRETPYGNTSFINDRVWRKWLMGMNNAENCKKTCSYFLEPYSYEDIFRFFERNNQKLKICLAHYGGAEQIAAAIKGTKDPVQQTPYGIDRKNWFIKIQELISTHPGAYTDISYDVAQGAAEKKFRFLFDTFLAEANKPYGHKILFGTDFFMTEREGPEKDTYNVFKGYAASRILDNGVTLWDQIARHNPNEYLASKYYDR